MRAVARFRKCVCLALALPLQALAASTVVSLDRVAQAPAEAWSEFLQSSDFDTAYSAYAVLEKVGYSAEGIDAEACREHRVELDDAVGKVPVSVAVLRGALLCAEGTGETEKAEKLEQALLALSKEALKNGRQQPWPKPIRVLGPADVYALLSMAGLKVSNEYFELYRPERHYPLVVAAWDEEKGRETRLVFDYVDPVATLKGTNEYAGYPYYRNLLVDFYVDAQAGAKQLAAVDQQAMNAARETAGTQAKVKAVRISAGYGGIQSLRLWTTLCAASPFEGCADGLADILIGLSEKKQAVPMTLLAFLHAEGVGVKRDAALADQLLAAAMRLWNEEGVALEYLHLADTTERPKAADRKVLADAMRKPAIVAVKAMQRILKEDKALSEAEVQVLSAPGSNGVGTGQAWLAEHWRQRENEALRIASLRLAAQAGEAYAQRSYAFHLLEEDRSPAERAQAQQWMRSAALGGDAQAMKYLFQQDYLQQNWKSAARWLMAAVVANDTEAMLQLAQLYEQDHQDAGQTVKQAFDWYVLMADNDHMPEARRRAARLAIQGKGTPKDTARALQWLKQDAEAGDTTSQMQLALAYLDGDFGADQRKSAQVWIDRVMAANANDPKMGYAEWLYHRSAAAEDRTRAVGIWEALDKAGEPWAVNNMAWAFCTAVEPSARNVKRGVELSEAILKKPDLMAPFLDTAAACQAAAGDYSRAAETQRRAISKYAAYWGWDADTVIHDSKDEDGYTTRLKLYQQGKPYVDKRSSEPDA